MQRWEYLVLRVDRKYDLVISVHKRPPADKIQTLAGNPIFSSIEQLGNIGWELTAIEVLPHEGEAHALFWFKRPIEPGP